MTTGSTKAEKLADMLAGLDDWDTSAQAVDPIRNAAFELRRLSPIELRAETLEQELGNAAKEIARQRAENATLSEELERLSAECEALRKDAERLELDRKINAKAAKQKLEQFLDEYLKYILSAAMGEKHE